MSTAVETSELLSAVSNGERTAFAQLYAATSAKIYGVVLRILRRHDLAAEVIEEVYLEIWRTAGEFDPEAFSPFAWMVAIARRRAIDRMRQSETDGTENEPEIEESDGPGAVPRREITDDLKRLLTCIGRLDPNRQRMLLLAYYGAFSRAQLAVKLDVPEHSVQASLRNSLSELEQCLTA